MNKVIGCGCKSVRICYIVSVGSLWLYISFNQKGVVMSDNNKVLLFGAKAQTTRPASEIIKSTIGFEKVDGDWYVSLWAKNLEDKRNITSIGSGSPLQGGISFVTFDEGMRAGLEFGMEF